MKLLLFLLLTVSIYPQTDLLLYYYSDDEVTYNSNAQTYFASLTTPLNVDTKQKISDYCDCLDDSLNAGARNKTLLQLGLDRMWLLANQTSEAALKDLVTLSNATAVNSPTFTAFEGYTGNGTSSYINTNWNGRTAGHAVAYTLNSASFGIYFRTTTDKAGFEVHGVWSTSPDGGNGSRLQLNRPNGADNNYSISINSSFNASASTDRISGMYVGSRTASNVQHLYLNSDTKVNGTATTTKIPNQNVLLLALTNTDGSALFFENDQIAFAFLGKGFTETQVRQITNCFENKYMDSNGKGVIP